MSQAQWKTPPTQNPYGFRVTIERSHHGSRESLTFRAKTPARCVAVKAASYKQGFLRLIAVVPLTRAEWEREFGVSVGASPNAGRCRL